jgi:hypothetical protein
MSPIITALGRGTTVTRGGSYKDPASRSFKFDVSIDELGLATLPDRMAESLHRHLETRLNEVAHKIIATAQASLVPGHGYDTGLLHNSLIARLVAEAEGIFYDLLSERAHYWQWVEFGHHLRNGGWWEGYHYLEEAVIANEGSIRQAIREAFYDTVQDLAMESRFLGAVGL